MITYRKCPVCQNERQNVLEAINLQVPEDFLLPYNYNIVECTKCGMVYNDVPQTEGFDKYYSSYKENTNFTIPDEDEYKTNRSKRESRFKKTAEFIGYTTDIDKEAYILDIGCSYGAMLMELKSMGYSNLYGLDLDQASLDYVCKCGINGINGSIFCDMGQEFSNKFDLIVLGHILEHLHQPKEAINNITKWLKPNGKIMIECPDVTQYPETSQFPGFFAEYEHINHFSHNSLENLLRSFRLKAYKADTIYALIEKFPCIYTLFVKQDNERSIVYSNNDAVAMKNSIKNKNSLGEYIFSKIEALQDTPVALWGAGQYLYGLLSHSPLSKCNIKYIVDRNPKKWGKRLFDMEISSPEILFGFKGTIVVCTTTAFESIRSDIENMGLKNNIVVACKEE